MKNKEKKLIEKKSNFIYDVFLNMIASFIVTGTMQLMVYPYLAQAIGSEQYGVFLTSIGISNILAVTLGGSLNNVRLLKEQRYIEKKITGDFNLLCIISLLIIIVLLPISQWFTMERDISSISLILIITILSFFRSYYSVGYRLNINYKKYLIQCFIYCFGGILGLLTILFTSLIKWQIPFIMAELAAVIYIIITNKGLIIEPINKTELFWDTTKDFVYLDLCTLIGNLLTYLDRLILLPLLGGAMVSTYYTATFFGKTLGIVMGPIAGVLLTYYAKRTKISLKQFWIQSGLVLFSSLLFFIIALILAKPVTRLLYPSLIESAIPYLTIANLSAILLVASSIIQPAVLRFCKVSFQLIIQIMHMAVYCVLGIILQKKFGLYGFCIAVACANAVKLVMLLMVGTITIGKNNEIIN